MDVQVSSSSYFNAKKSIHLERYRYRGTFQFQFYIHTYLLGSSVLTFPSPSILWSLFCGRLFIQLKPKEEQERDTSGVVDTRNELFGLFRIRCCGRCQAQLATSYITTACLVIHQSRWASFLRFFSHFCDGPRRSCHGNAACAILMHQIPDIHKMEVRSQLSRVLIRAHVKPETLILVHRLCLCTH